MNTSRYGQCFLVTKTKRKAITNQYGDQRGGKCFETFDWKIKKQHLALFL